MKTLLIIPTYNERDNVTKLCHEILKLNLPIDILFIDDNSPDGTGDLLEELSIKHKNIKAQHRKGKLGIGSAHFFGINYAYENNYSILLSMDADFTHKPEYLIKLFELKDKADVIIASRYIAKNSLPGWNILRRILTYSGHFLTKILLGMEHDATGALRLYRIDKIPKSAFDIVDSKGYSFFFESLYVLFKNNFTIIEIPIELPARTYGSSKMDFNEVKKSVILLFKTYLQSQFRPCKYKIASKLKDSEIDSEQKDRQGWDSYWETKKEGWKFVYDIIANIYRNLLIRPSLDYHIEKTFKSGQTILHAGCGGGQVDINIRKYLKIVPLDISVNALNWYKQVNNNCEVIHGSIFSIPSEDNYYDGIYNLGVMEHFNESDINKILIEFHRTLKPGGKLVLFWPHEFGISVIFFKILKYILSCFGKKNIKFHPDEITRIYSKSHAKKLIENNKFSLNYYYFGPYDMFTQAVLICSRID